MLTVVGGGPTVSMRVVGVNNEPYYHAAKQVLLDTREQFIADMDASTLVMELSSKIPHCVQERISRTDGPEKKNEILHDWLQRTCSKEALMDICDIIVAVKDHPKMQELGETMKRRLQTGISLLYANV